VDAISTAERALDSVVRLLQFGDSVFPVGSFTFSNGLEMAVQTGVVHDRATLAAYVRTVTRQAATSDAIAVLAGHRAAVAGDVDRIRRADEAVLLRKLNEEARAMTVRMGRKLAEAASRIVGDSMLDKRVQAGVDDPVPVTYPVALGALFAALDLSEQDAFAVHQYGTAMVVLSAALRLMRVGHLDAQEILFAVNATAADDYREVAAAGLEDMRVFAPVVDVLAAAHRDAHVRMFMN
jgi:Urease accessory protein UreF